MGDYLFYGLATALVTFSLLAVSLPNLLHGAISLIAAFFVTAALYIMLQLEFVALAQIMLYIGGIIIFMLIIILLTTGLGVEDRHKVPTSRRLAGAGISAVLLFGLLYAIGSKPSAILIEDVHRAAPVTMDDIGLRLFQIPIDNNAVVQNEDTLESFLKSMPEFNRDDPGNIKSIKPALNPAKLKVFRERLELIKKKKGKIDFNSILNNLQGEKSQIFAIDPDSGKEKVIPDININDVGLEKLTPEEIAEKHRKEENKNSNE